ncbi:MAG: hypothetical protein ABII00_14295 [Elusimicrobiota bacterium]
MMATTNTTEVEDRALRILLLRWFGNSLLAGLLATLLAALCSAADLTVNAANEAGGAVSRTAVDLRIL